MINYFTLYFFLNLLKYELVNKLLLYNIDFHLYSYNATPNYYFMNRESVSSILFENKLLQSLKFGF